MPRLAIVTIHPDLVGLHDHVLRQVCRPVDLADPAQLALCRQLAVDMFEALYASGGSALAAPQVAVTLRMFVADPPHLPFGPYVFINPEIVARSEAVAVEEEGCLSIPGFRGRVARPAEVTLRAFTLQGEAVELELSGFPARLAQHEIDHLDGVLYPDRFAEDAGLEPGPGAHRRRAERALAQLDAAAVL
jgi:peptide deformylase